MRPARKFKRPASRFRKISTGFGIGLASVVAAALILPGYVDWSRFKDEIEHQASAITGRQVRIEGAIGFSMLPRPALTLEKATLANSAGAAEPVMLGLERLEAQLGILPLLSGNIQVANFRLIAPVLNLETLPDGARNWTWKADGQNSFPGIRFDRVLIERGSVHYRNHITGASMVLEEMNLQIAAGSLQGPFEARGALRLQDVPVSLDAALGGSAPGRATSISVKSVLSGDAGVDFTGSITAEGDLTGNLISQGADFTSLLVSIAQLGVPALSGVQPAMLHLPYRLQGSLASGAGSLKFDKLKLKLGENTLTGSVLFDMGVTPAFEATLNAASLDLDAWRASVPATTVRQPAPENGFRIPRDISGGLRFTGNAVKLNDGHIRDVTLAATVAGGIATIDELSAQLPGSTAARIAGQMTAAKGQPHFTGKLDLQAGNLRGLLGWLGVEAPDMPERSLSRAELTAQLDLSPELSQLDEITAEIDSSKLTGSLAIVMRERTALGIDVSIDQLNADSYLPGENDLARNVPSTDNTAPDARASWTAARDLIERFDSNFILSVKALTYRGVPITGLQADGAVIDGTLAVNSFTIADIAGTAFSMSGVLSNFAGAAEGEVNLRLASNDLGGLSRTMGVTLPVPGAQLGKSSIEAKFLLANAGVEALIDSRFGETSLLVAGGASGFSSGVIAAFGKPAAFKARLSLANPSLRKIAAQGGLEIFPTAAEDAAGIAVSAELSGTPSEISLNALNGTIGTLPIQGTASWNATGPKPILRAEVTAGEILADNFLQSTQLPDAGKPAPRQQLPWSGAPLDLTYLDQLEAEVKLGAGRFSVRGYDIAKPALVLEIRDGQASVKKFTGSLFGGEASATASLRGGGAAPELAASWKVQGADMQAASIALSGSPVITGRLDFTGAVKGAGASSFALVSNLEGEAQITAVNGFIQGINLPAFSSGLASLERGADFMKLAETVLQGGNTPYKRISIPFSINRGIAQSDSPAVNIDSVSGGLEASIDLPRYWLNAEASLTLNEHMNAPPLGIAYIGPLNNPERTLRTNRLENHFTQALLSKSLQRVINNRDAQPHPAPDAITQQAAPPAPQQAPLPPKENTARKMINGILDGIIKDKPE